MRSTGYVLPQLTKNCFISYKHPPAVRNDGGKHIYLEFVQALEGKLAHYLRTVRPYRDTTLRQIPGAPYPSELSRALCHSVCMIGVLVPEYSESNWCVAEWQAMEKLERIRLGNGRKGLIIPVLFRGEIGRFQALVGDRQPLDMSTILKPKTQLDNVSYRQKVESLCERIEALAKGSNPSKVDCDTFKIDEGPEFHTPDSRADPNPVAGT